MIETSLDILWSAIDLRKMFGNFHLAFGQIKWKIFENLWKLVGNLKKFATKDGCLEI